MEVILNLFVFFVGVMSTRRAEEAREQPPGPLQIHTDADAIDADNIFA
jgi:hypothetical protein